MAAGAAPAALGAAGSPFPGPRLPPGPPRCAGLREAAPEGLRDGSSPERRREGGGKASRGSGEASQRNTNQG